MNQLCNCLLLLALDRKATDIHLELRDDSLIVSLRTENGLEVLDQDLFGAEFLEYLKYRSGMDLCSPYKPQSGEFSLQLAGKEIDCRFAMMNTDTIQTGVIRLLHETGHFQIEDLTRSREAHRRLLRLCQTDHGLVISCGPTGSGKSTTVHAMLNRILDTRSRKIVTLEDPVEIQEPRMIQISVSPARGITYENALSELLRHDPDILFFGECRTSYAAKMTVRASLTGHAVYTTLHAGSGLECIFRLLDLGVDEKELQSILRGIFVCRLISENGKKECLYEIWNEEDIAELFRTKEEARPGLSFEACQSEEEKSDSH